MQHEPDETLDEARKVAFRCTCGADVLLEQNGSGQCPECGRNITLGRLDPSQTISFQSEFGSGTSFHVSEGHDRTGQSLGHFKLLSKLGYGGMGEVYRALDQSLQRFVAVKLIREGDEAQSRKLIARLLEEAIAQARLNHPNVVTIYYVGREEEEPFFAMELLPGPTLAQLIEQEPLSYEDVIRYARQVCSAMSQANRLGLVHGDLKPSNLILAGDHLVKLSDFGLSQTKDSERLPTLAGTINYLAPELTRGEQPTIHSDMYSLGVTLFELTFGRKPYTIEGDNLREQIRSQQAAQIDFPEKWPSTVPERFRTVLARMMAKDPNDRFHDFDELDEVLKDHAPAGVTPASFVVRAVALGVDYAFLFLFMLPFLAIAQPETIAQLSRIRLPAWSVYLAPAVLLIPLVATLWESRGFRTLGRYFLQLRLVDRHGLLLEPRKRIIRSLIRTIPIWMTSVVTILLAFGFDLLAVFLSPIDELLMLVDMIPGLGPKKLAVHDRLVGSRVVLDTRSASDTDSE